MVWPPPVCEPDLVKVWLAYGAVLAVAVFDLVAPADLVVLSFAWVPVMATAPWGRPRVTAGLAVWAGLCVLAVGWLSGYFSDASYWVRLVAMGLISAIGVAAADRLQQDQQELRELSLRDPLTGLPNRRLLAEHLAARLAARDQTPLAVLYIDLDRFKAVNTRYGHDGGDAVLQSAAARFSGQLRQGDLLARIGGDEFVVVCSEPSGTLESTERLCGRLIGSLDAPVPAAPGADVGATIGGVVCLPSGGMSAADLLAKADEELMGLKGSAPGSYAVRWCDR